MKVNLPKMLTAAVTASISGTAVAHPGHGSDMLAGLLHPVSGLDHLLAAFAVGMWAAVLGRTARWAVPACFVLVMAATSLLASIFPAAATEAGIGISLLALGLLIAFSISVKSSYAILGVGAFAMFHGTAHAIEMPVLAVGWQYCVGLSLSTLALHLLGIGVGTASQHQRGSRFAFAGLTAFAGGWTLAAF